MTLIEAAIYGVIQGLAEFLPISSSGHLAIAHWMMGSTNMEDDVAFDVSLHIGTLIPVVAYFWKDWYNLLKGFFQSFGKGDTFKNPDSVLLIQLVIATIPGAIFGLLFEKYAKTIFRSPVSIAIMLIIMGLILWLADRWAKERKEMKGVSWLDSIIVGCSQAFAIIPGVSRSGVTITAGLFRNFNRETAAKFSFLLSAPIIMGAALHELPALLHHHDFANDIVGIITAALVGWLAIAALLNYIRKHSFMPFVIYRIAFGLFVIVYYYYSIR